MNRYPGAPTSNKMPYQRGYAESFYPGVHPGVHTPIPNQQAAHIQNYGYPNNNHYGPGFNYGNNGAMTPIHSNHGMQYHGNIPNNELNLPTNHMESRGNYLTRGVPTMFSHYQTNNSATLPAPTNGPTIIPIYIPTNPKVTPTVPPPVAPTTVPPPVAPTTVPQPPTVPPPAAPTTVPQPPTVPTPTTATTVPQPPTVPPPAPTNDKTDEILKQIASIRDSVIQQTYDIEYLKDKIRCCTK